MPHANADLIERFYTAFNACDGVTMAAAYTSDAHFSDPVFQDLRGAEPGAMWIMLTGRAKDLRVELVEHDADEFHGTAHWLADYTFSTGRKVHNDVRATFVFHEGRIVDHHDDFSFHGWARQALGPMGLLLGWTPFLKAKIRAQAREGLDEALAATPSASQTPQT
jgi:ketosteroid isomerase-like protein